MTRWISGCFLASILALSACENMTTEQRTVAGVAGGAAGGLIAAEAFDANDEWRLIAALASRAPRSYSGMPSSTKEPPA